MKIFEIALIVIAVLIALVFVRILIGPTIWDRLLGFNMVSSKINMSIVLLALVLDKSYLLDVAIVYAVLGFIGTVFIARFIEGRGNFDS